jgi:hypothetical protein
MPVTAVHLLNTDVLPTFEAHGIEVKTALSDNGREFCGRPDRHPYRAFLDRIPANDNSQEDTAHQTDQAHAA